MTDFSEFELWWKYLGKHKCSRQNKWCGKVTYYMFKWLDLVNFFDLDTKFTQRFSMFCLSKQAAEVSGRMKSNLWNQDVCKHRNICCLEFNSHWIYYISTVTTLKLCGWLLLTEKCNMFIHTFARYFWYDSKGISTAGQEIAARWTNLTSSERARASGLTQACRVCQTENTEDCQTSPSHTLPDFSYTFLHSPTCIWSPQAEVRTHTHLFYIT